MTFPRPVPEPHTLAHTARIHIFANSFDNAGAIGMRNGKIERDWPACSGPGFYVRWIDTRGVNANQHLAIPWGMEHVEALLPEICSLDCGSFNYPGGNYVYISTPNMLELGAARLQKIGVKPELEVFDMGHIWFAKELLKNGLLDAPPLFQVCMGVRWGAEATPRNFLNMVENLPSGANWAGFALGAQEMPFVAQGALLGGHVRVGLEDNLYLPKGQLATNAQLVERARTIVEGMGANVQTSAQARETLGLEKQATPVLAKDAA